MTESLTPETVSKYTFKWIEESAESTINNFKKYIQHTNSDEAKFEAMLIYYLIAVRVFKRDIQRNFDEYETGLFEELLAWAERKGIIDKLRPNEFDFINDRLKMVNDDLGERYEDDQWMMAQTIHAIFYEPLKRDITINNCFLNRSDLLSDNPIIFFFAPDLLKTINVLTNTLKLVTAKINAD